MKRDLDALTGSQFDLVVIGGGVFGACAAWDAVQRGLSVALIEREDFGNATSANSYKIVHGGIRYVQHGDVYRVRQSSHERRALLRIAPHLVHPLPIVIPTYGHGMKGRQILRAGMAVYDVLTADRNRGIQDPDRRIPWGRSLGRDDVLDLFPDLDRRDLTGAAVFCDGQMYNPPRLVLAFVQSAARAGAVVANYMEAVGFIGDDTEVQGVRARDVLNDTEVEIRGRVVLNAAGPYAEHLLRRARHLRLSPEGVYSRDACFVVPHRLFKHECALAVQGKTSDPEALLSRGERHLFVAPWRDYTLIGTWHVVHKGDPNEFTVTDEELERFINEATAGYPGLHLSLDDVSMWNAGLVPFGQNPDGAINLRYGHRSRLIDHQGAHGIRNLITLIGVRFTTGRYEAERAVALTYAKLGRKPPRSRTDSVPVFGGDIDDWKSQLDQMQRIQRNSMELSVIESLAHNYGSEYQNVLRIADENIRWKACIGRSVTIGAQVVHAVRQEMAMTLADVVLRRTDLGTGEYPGRHALAESARLMAGELGWSDDECRQQVEAVAERFRRRAVEESDRPETGAASVPSGPNCAE